MDKGYTVTVQVYNGLQYVSILSALIGTVIISTVLFLGLLHNKAASINHYKDIILMLSGTYCLTSLCYLTLLPVFTHPTGLVYVWGRFYPYWLSYLLSSAADLFMKMGNILLVVSMIYKVTSFVRPNWLSQVRFVLICLTIPPPLIQIIFLQPQDIRMGVACDLLCVDDLNQYPTRWYLKDMTERNLVSNILDWVIFLAVIVAGIPSILILNNWFRVGNFSPKTRKLQKKLTKAWMILMILHSFIFLPQFCLWLEKVVPLLGGVDITLVLASISIALNYWAIPLKVLVIFLTVRRLLYSPDWLRNFRMFPNDCHHRKSVTPM